jgi:hypothetical protein
MSDFWFNTMILFVILSFSFGNLLKKLGNMSSDDNSMGGKLVRGFLDKWLGK